MGELRLWRRRRGEGGGESGVKERRSGGKWSAARFLKDPDHDTNAAALECECRGPCYRTSHVKNTQVAALM